MTVQLDHCIVPTRKGQQVAAAKLLAELLGVPWSATTLGPFSPVYVNEGLTLDFQETDQPFPVYHFCFRVSQAEFDAIIGRIKAADIPFRSTVFGPMDNKVNEQYGNIYWIEPEGHMWEILTVSYARQPA